MNNMINSAEKKLAIVPGATHFFEEVGKLGSGGAGRLIVC
jgi:hypothetical protein